MLIEYLASLFETHPIMLVVASLFITNLSITGCEIILDILTEKERRWKDTVANCVIFFTHQVVEKTGTNLNRFADLSDAFRTIDKSFGSEWRIHFHVPIFLKKMDQFHTTQDFLKEILNIHKNSPISQHLEVETYTWDVLPSNYRDTPVNQAIARELNWVIGQLNI